MDKKIESKELESLQGLNAEFNTIKTQLGDLSLQKHGLCLKVEEIKTKFQLLENELTEKYGKDVVINLETGEVKDKEKLEKNGKDK
tara:strand:+ start:225 stop:482 length:258 start_codon:yes stop_codon:yes gene_type:complete